MKKLYFGKLIFICIFVEKKLKKMIDDYLTKILKQCFILETEKLPNKKYYIYNEKYIRDKKICKILNINNIKFDPNYNEIILEQNLKYKYFIVNSNIWNRYQNVTMLNWQKIRNLIRKILEKELKISDFKIYRHVVWYEDSREIIKML